MEQDRKRKNIIDNYQNKNECVICNETIIQYFVGSCCSRQGCKNCQIRNVIFNGNESKCCYCSKKIPIHEVQRMLQNETTPKNISSSKNSKEIIKEKESIMNIS